MSYKQYKSLKEKTIFTTTHHIDYQFVTKRFCKILKEFFCCLFGKTALFLQCE